MADAVRVSVTVNGRVQEATVEPRLLLVHLLRDTLGLTGTHVGCDTSNCGACTVHVDGESVKSCTLLAVQADGAEVTDDRGHGAGHRPAPAAGGLLGRARPAVRLLHARHDHGRGRPARAQPRPERGRDPSRARRQPLPLHGLPQHRQGGAARRAAPGAAARSPSRRCPRRRPRTPRSWRRRGGRMSDDGNGTADVGQRMRRKEDPPLLQGKGNYIDDIALPGHAVRGVRPLAGGARADHARSTPRRRSRATASTPSSPARTSTSRPACRSPGSRPASRSRRPEHWPLAKEVVKHVGDPVAVVIGADTLRRRRRGRGRARRLRPAAGRRRRRGGARGRRPRAPRPRHEQGPRLVARRRRRVRARRGGGRDRAALRQPPHRGRADRAPRGDRRLSRRRPDRLELDPDPQLPAHVPRGAARHDGGPDPRRSRPTSAAASGRSSRSTARRSCSPGCSRKLGRPSSGSRRARRT